MSPNLSRNTNYKYLHPSQWAMSLMLFGSFGLILHDTPNSWYNWGEPGVERGMRRMKDGIRFLKEYTPESLKKENYIPMDFMKPLLTSSYPILTPESEVQICVGVVTVFRRTQYIEYTIGSLLDTLLPDERAVMHLAVLLMDEDPSRSLEYLNRFNISKYMDAVITYPCNNKPSSVHLPSDYVSTCARVKNTTRNDSNLAPLEGLRGFERIISGYNQDVETKWKMKEVFDYALTLQYCLEGTKAPWCLVLEDDVVAAKRWPMLIQNALREVERFERGELIESGWNWPWASSLTTSNIIVAADIRKIALLDSTI
ncbi:uncharacterized protein VTP21DRAFT_585 [Calcarisporiella thermophila]|uniref:uncharacterized protein n=1 Tax=Calcarisporiella thermophila TaxID=911321 RepID=UPI00374410BF